MNTTPQGAGDVAGCGCVDKVDGYLAERNTRITRALILSEPSLFRALIETEQVEHGRGKPKATSMFATFCPFCGVKYELASSC